MKYIYIIIALIAGFAMQAQTSSAVNFQGLLLGVDGNGLANRTADFRIIISKDFQGTDLHYIETQEVTTSSNGVFDIQIGNGTPVIGDYETIDWLTAIPWLTIEYDLMDGQGIQVIGPQSFQVVPFCFSSKYIMCQDGAQGYPGPAGAQGFPGAFGTQAIGPQGNPGPNGLDGIANMPILETPPNNAEEGTIYLDDGSNRTDTSKGFRYYTGTAWLDL